MDKLNAEISSIGAIDDATKVAADEIWLFVEEKLKTPVPAYFKNVLSVCGYNNGISIATIVADDISYIESQVRNGKVGKVFTELKVENFLEGCTMKEKEFEFVRGHKKFLEVIVDFLNGHLKEYGPGSFGLKADLKGKSSKKLVNNVKKREGKILVRQPRKKTFSAQSLVDFAMKTELEIQKYSPSISRDILNEHRRILLSKTLISMHRITETLFKKNLEKIKNKISGNFLSFELESGDDPRALVWCIYCNKSIAVFLRPTENNDFLWKATNFDRHLNLVHREESDNLSCSENEKPPKVDNELDNKKFQETGNSSQLDNNSPKAKSLQETGTEDESVSGNSSKKKDRCEGTGDLVESEDNKTQETKGRVQETGNLSESNNKEPPKTKNRVQGMGNSIQLNKDWPGAKSLLQETGTEDESVSGNSSKKKDRFEGTGDLVESEDNKTQETKGRVQETQADGKSDNEKLSSLMKRSQFSVPILKNGHKSGHDKEFLITTNTCAFDTIFFTYAWLYLGNLYVRNQIDNSNSKMSALIKALFKCETTTDMQHFYASRNTILKHLYSNWCKNSITSNYNTTFVDCKTGIGGLYARICLNVGSNFASGIEEKKCIKCDKVITKLLPLIPTKGNVKNLEKLNDCIDLSLSHKKCTICKNECDIKRYYNNVVAVEVEPRCLQYRNRNKKIALNNVCPNISINNNQYELCTVMHFEETLDHFVCYTRQNSNYWSCYDDLKKAKKKNSFVYRSMSIYLMLRIK